MEYTPYYSQRDDIIAFAEESYGTTPEYLWQSDPDSAVLRNNTSGKWYAIIMDIKRSTFDLDGDGYIDVMNIKCKPEDKDILLMKDGFYPAYHMNKKHWVSILLDGTVDTEDILLLIENSYNMTFRGYKK